MIIYHFRSYGIRASWWIAMGTICLVNFIAVGIRKFWHHRKAKLAASQNPHQANIANQPNANNSPGLFNNAIHNSDVISLKNIFLFCLIGASLKVVRMILFVIMDEFGNAKIALYIFITNRITHITLFIISPLILLVSKKDARQHVKFLFWNEWAPDFVQVYNPNRVHEIKLNPTRKV